MSRLALSPEPLTKAAFADYGEVIETEGATRLSINDGFAERFHDLATIDVSNADGQPLLNIFRAAPRPMPIEIDHLERHPLGSQAFMPLAQDPFLVLVAQQPDPAALRLFISNGRQGVNYRRGVWHYPLLVLRQPGDFLVIDRGGSGDNCEICRFERHAVIDMR